MPTNFFNCRQQTSSDGMSMTRRNYLRQSSAPARMTRPINMKARMRWRKIKLAICFINKVKLPEGPKGEMCKIIQDDVDFGR